MDNLRRSEVFKALDPRRKAELARQFNELQGRTDGVSTFPHVLMQTCAPTSRT